MSYFEGAIWLPNNNYFPGRDGQRPRWIILHGTAGGSSAEAIANYFASTQGGNNPVSSHYVVGQDGEIVQCVSEADGAWSNGLLTAGHDPWWPASINPNNLTISIEHCKPDRSNATALTPAQQASSFRLIKDICIGWNIPCKGADASGGITGHFSIDPVNRRNCPGLYPWSQLWQFLAASGDSGGEEENMRIDLNTPGVAQYFEATGDAMWRCKTTGHLVGHAILDFYTSFGGRDTCGLTHLGLPVSEEQGLEPGVVAQRFERAVLIYDPQYKHDRPVGITGPVYLAHI